jgi:hypothetical protein
MVWRSFTKLKTELPQIQQFDYWSYFQKKWNHYVEETAAFPYSSIHKSEEIETT